MRFLNLHFRSNFYIKNSFRHWCYFEFKYRYHWTLFSFNYVILDWLIEIWLIFSFFYRRKLFIIFENILRNYILLNLRIHKFFFAVLKFWLHIIFITYYIYKSFRLANIVFLAIVCNLFGIGWNINWRIFDKF